MNKKKRLLSIAAGIAALAVAALLFLWLRPKPIRVALVNMPEFMYAKMVLSVDAKNASVEAEEDVDKLKKYDAVLIFGMGLKWTDEERAKVRELDKKGIKFQTMMITNPDNNLSNIDSIKSETLIKYFTNGGTLNYKHGLNYLRKEILGHSLREGTIKAPIEYAANIFFGKENDEAVFTNIKDYEAWYRSNGYKPGAPKVALIAGFTGPFNSNRDHFDAIIGGLEAKGMNVYPMLAGMKRIELLDEVQPDLIVYMPHGRFSAGKPKEMEEWLRKRNVPVLAPVTITDTYENWMADPKGMMGGFMSQSVVTPEIDGAIVPFALVALEEQPSGIKIFKAIPDRLEQFCNLAKNYIALQKKPNSEKKVAIYYFKGPGQNSMVAQGLETLPSLYNTLIALRDAGYRVDGLPSTVKEFEQMIMSRGVLFNNYAEGSRSKYLESDYPAFVSTDSLRAWVGRTFTQANQDSIRKHHGQEPGYYMTIERSGKEGIAVARVEFGNVVLLPQPGQGAGDNDFKMVHGSQPVPAYPFIAAYLWARNDFKADAMMHFGTHGSLEFIPGKAVALSSDDYTDRLVYDIPHVYYYTTANVGESIMAKRRSYAQVVSYLAPPFMGTELEDGLKTFMDMTDKYLSQEQDDDKLSLQIKRLAVREGYHRDLKLDSNTDQPYSRSDIEMLADFIEELAKSKVTSGLYTTGVSFSPAKITKSVQMLSVDPVAYALSYLDKQRGKVTEAQLRNQSYYGRHYLRPAESIVRRVQAAGKVNINDELRRCGLTESELKKAAEIEERMLQFAQGMNMMAAMMSSGPASMDKAVKKKEGGGHPSWIPKIGKRPKHVDEKKSHAKSAPKADKPQGGHPGGGMGGGMLTFEEKQFAEAIMMLRDALQRISFYEQALRNSPSHELKGIVNALNGGYTAPSPGGDYIADPQVLPSGRNLFSINPENTPTEKAWKHAMQLGDGLLADYQKRHNGAYPKKVSFSLWSSSFIESEGTTVGEILYLLGVRPVRDRLGRVLDVELIPDEELKRPRIDVVVQTSGQLRDIAASRLFLIQKAVELAAEAPKGTYDNHITSGVQDAEKLLLSKGVPPAQARALSTARVFGGVNGNYGTGIQAMVKAGDKWEKESEIADVYMNNMGAIYGSADDWGAFTAGAFEAALQNTDAVVQPRQSNTWGALSLDHVYEFMGGLTLTVRHVTGKDPEGYFTDLRNRNRVRTQEIKQAIGVEARTTILNPTFVKELMKEGASAADGLAETIRNTYGWNVMKPSAIDDELWDDIYDMYVADKHKLGVQEFFERVNPAALQDYTSSMMETIRKGMWKATPEQIKAIAELHAQSVAKVGAGCSEMVCANAKTRQFIEQQLNPEAAKEYKDKMSQTLNRPAANSNSKNKVLRKEGEENNSARTTSEESSATTSFILIGGVALLVILLIIFSIRRRKQRSRNE